MKPLKSSESITVCSVTLNTRRRRNTPRSGSGSGGASFHAGEYPRRAKGGREVWLQASYNPVRDLQGNPIKIVKLAADITAAAVARTERRAAQTEIANELRSVADGTARSTAQAREAEQASIQASENVQAIASGVEELSASFGEIGRRVSEALTVSRAAVENARKTRETMTGLSDSAQAIGKVVELINAICRTDQSAGAERDNRGSAPQARQARAFCGSGQRGEVSGQPDLEGH